MTTEVTRPGTYLQPIERVYVRGGEIQGDCKARFKALYKALGGDFKGAVELGFYGTRLCSPPTHQNEQGVWELLIPGEGQLRDLANDVDAGKPIPPEAERQIRERLDARLASLKRQTLELAHLVAQKASKDVLAGEKTADSDYARAQSAAQYAESVAKEPARASPTPGNFTLIGLTTNPPAQRLHQRAGGHVFKRKVRPEGVIEGEVVRSDG